MKNNMIQTALIKWKAKIIRVDGSVEYDEFSNLVSDAGMDFLADFISSSPASAMNFVAVGTGNAAGSLGMTALANEIDRNIMGTKASSKNVWITVCTFAGNTDSITSVALTEAGVFNNVLSGTGTMFQRVQGTIATLGASDFLELTIETTIGSRST